MNVWPTVLLIKQIHLTQQQTTFQLMNFDCRYLNISIKLDKREKK